MASRSEEDVLIIEDDGPPAILLTEYLQKLGYQKIYICKNGTSGISKFQELAKSSNVPIVFLDYYLPDIGADRILRRILETRRDTKVIVETAADQSERGIKRLFELGAHHYYPKPYKFEKLKEIMDTLEQLHN